MILKITKHQQTDDDKLNIKSEFKVTYKGFIRIGEITFAVAQRAAPLFIDTKVIRANISCFELNQSVTLRLKTSKTDINHTKVLIVTWATDWQNCPVTDFYNFFFSDLKQGYVPLFSWIK